MLVVGGGWDGVMGEPVDGVGELGGAVDVELGVGGVSVRLAEEAVLGLGVGLLAGFYGADFGKRGFRFILPAWHLKDGLQLSGVLPCITLVRGTVLGG